MGDIYGNVPVLDTGARGSTTTFAQRGLGDVLISWENEAFLVLNEFGADGFEIVVPSESILAEPPVALVDGNVDAKGTRKIAQAYLEFLYTPEAQALIAKHFYRPSDPKAAAPEDWPACPSSTSSRSRSASATGRRRRRPTSPTAASSTRSISRSPEPMAAATLALGVRRRPRVIPGFGLTLGLTLTYLCLVVLIPLAGLFSRARACPLARILAIVTDQRTLAALELSFGAALVAALVNLVMGTLVAWVLVRYKFPGRRLLDAVVDLPFALPTAVAGIALASLYAPNGWIGGLLAPLGLKVAFTPLGVVVALTFIGLPFVVRTVQPVLEDLERGRRGGGGDPGRLAAADLRCGSCCRPSCRRS